jgi:hypothetical protein
VLTGLVSCPGLLTTLASRDTDSMESIPKAAAWRSDRSCRGDDATASGRPTGWLLRCGKNFNLLFSPGREAARCKLSGRQPSRCGQPGKGPKAELGVGFSCPMGSVEPAAGSVTEKRSTKFCQHPRKMHGTKPGISTYLRAASRLPLLVGRARRSPAVITLHRTFAVADRRAVERKISNSSPPRSPGCSSTSLQPPSGTGFVRRDAAREPCKQTAGSEPCTPALSRNRTLDGRYG